MDTQDHEIEAQLKERLARVVPSRASFDAMREQVVTKAAEHRSTYREASVPSPYQSLFSFIMNKTMLIGVPVAVIAVVAVILVMKPNNVDTTKVAMIPPQQEQAAQRVDQNAQAPANPAPVAANVDTSSIDSITSGFMADANADAASVTNDTSDQTAVNADLANYDTVKTNPYDIAI